MAYHNVDYFWKNETLILEKEYELTVKKQAKLVLKIGRAAACPETGTAQASADKESEKKPPFSAVWSKMIELRLQKKILSNLI